MSQFLKSWTSPVLTPYYSWEHRKYALRVILMFMKKKHDSKRKHTGFRRCFLCISSFSWPIFGFFNFWCYSDFPEAGVNPKTCFVMVWSFKDLPGVISDRFRINHFSLFLPNFSLTLSPAFTRPKSIDLRFGICNPH